MTRIPPHGARAAGGPHAHARKEAEAPHPPSPTPSIADDDFDTVNAKTERLNAARDRLMRETEAHNARVARRNNAMTQPGL